MTKHKNDKATEVIPERKAAPRYTNEFKANAVKMVLELGISYSQAATKLGCTAESIRRWVWIHREKLHPQEVQEEINGVEHLKTLNKEIARLQMENEFLKKAAAYFAKESK